MMLLSAAAADTLHAPAEVGTFFRLDGVRDARAASMFSTLRADASGMRITADDERLLAMCEIAVDAMGGGDVDHPTSGAKSAWKAWLGYCSWAGVLPWRTDAAAALGSSEAARQRETVIWVNALMYIYPRMKPAPGRKEHPKPASALAILQHIRRMHVKLDVPVISLRPCVRAMQKLIEEWVEEYSVEALQPRRKAALTAQLIIELVRLVAVDPTLSDGDRPAWVAVWHLLAQTGFRKAEVALADGVSFNKFCISWDNIKWSVGGKVYPALTPALRNLMTDGDYLIVRPPPSKADPFALRWGISPIYLPYIEAAPICAARAVADLEIIRQPPTGKRSKTPLFATAAGAPFRRSNVTNHFDSWMARVGGARGWEAGASKKYSCHSFRVHLACALAAAGASDMRIQSMLRWASVDALHCYKQTAVETYGAWVAAASAVDINVHRSHHLPSEEGAGGTAWPAPEVPADQRTAERAHNIRYEADDIIAAARAAGVEALLAEAQALDDEVRRAVAPDADVGDLLVADF